MAEAKSVLATPGLLHKNALCLACSHFWYKLRKSPPKMANQRVQIMMFVGFVGHLIDLDSLHPKASGLRYLDGF